MKTDIAAIKAKVAKLQAEIDAATQELSNSCYTVELLEKKKHIVQFCHQLLREEKITYEQFSTGDSDPKSTYDLVSFLISLDRSQFNFIKAFLLGYRKQPATKAMSCDNSYCDSEENLPSPRLDKMDDTASDKQLHESVYNPQHEEEQIHNEILRYQKEKGCRYDEAATVVLGSL